MYIVQIVFFFFILIFLLPFVTEKYKKKLTVFCLLTFYFFSNGFIINFFGSFWEVKGENIETVHPSKCGIVLSGAFKYDQKLNRLIANSDADRIWQTIQLYKRNKIEKIFLCGKPELINLSKSTDIIDLKSLLIQMGINSIDIIEEMNSKNTYENAVECKKMLVKYNYHLQEHIIITSSLHMKRAKACFDKQGIITSSFSTSQINATRNHFNLKWLLPKTDNLLLWDKFFHQLTGYVGYNILGYL